jgi:hypothetical protein
MRRPAEKAGELARLMGAGEHERNVSDAEAWRREARRMLAHDARLTELSSRLAEAVRIRRDTCPSDGHERQAQSQPGQSATEELSHPVPSYLPTLSQ